VNVPTPRLQLHPSACGQVGQPGEVLAEQPKSTDGHCSSPLDLEMSAEQGHDSNNPGRDKVERDLPEFPARR
jgi:hypothetical protein